MECLSAEVSQYVFSFLLVTDAGGLGQGRRTWELA